MVREEEEEESHKIIPKKIARAHTPAPTRRTRPEHCQEARIAGLGCQRDLVSHLVGTPPRSAEPLPSPPSHMSQSTPPSTEGGAPTPNPTPPSQSHHYTSLVQSPPRYRSLNEKWSVQKIQYSSITAETPCCCRCSSLGAASRPPCVCVCVCVCVCMCVCLYVRACVQPLFSVSAKG